MPDTLLDWILHNEDSFRKPRLPSLYSDLTLQRQTNPAGYAFNVSAWQSALTHAALAGHLNNNTNTHLPNSSPAPPVSSSSSWSPRLTLHTSDSLLTSLSSRQYGRPLGLGAVISESVASGKMVPLSDFLKADTSIYARKSWIPSPWTLLRWGARTLGALVVDGQQWEVDGRLRAGELVVVENVEKVAAEVMRRQEDEFGQALTDRVWSRDAFVRQLATISPESASASHGSRLLGGSDVDVLLKFLHRDKQAASYSEKVVKFKAPSALQPEPITHQDNTIASLKSLISTLTDQCTNLSTRISTLTTDASNSIKSSNRISALSALRSKRLAQKTLQQRSDTLSQLEELYAKIEQAAGQVELVKIMEDSTVVLRGLNERVGGVDKVEDVIEELKVEVDKVDEIEQVISQPLGGDAVRVDEIEIDDELKKMEKEEEEKKKKLREADADAVTKARLDRIQKMPGLDEIEEEEKVQTDGQLERRMQLLRRPSSTPTHDMGRQVDTANPRITTRSATEKTVDPDSTIANPTPNPTQAQKN